VRKAFPGSCEVSERVPDRHPNLDIDRGERHQRRIRVPCAGNNDAWASAIEQCRSQRRARLQSRPRLEIRRVRDPDVILEQMLVVLGADFFVHRTLNAMIDLHHRPWRVESIRIVERDVHLHRLAALDQLKALDDVQLIGVGVRELLTKVLSFSPIVSTTSVSPS
jgi:hypothetical protein